MSKLYFNYLVLWFTFINVNARKLSVNSDCKTDEWKCDNGQCIAADLFCDGRYDCLDKSDETFLKCSQYQCSPYSFRCTYGGCLQKSRECDSVKDCFDNSDEVYCQANYEGMMGDISNCYRNGVNNHNCVGQVINQRMNNNMNCSQNQFNCGENSQCIPLQDLCDGTINCANGADEIFPYCANINCPPFAFRCAYGACISSQLKCNGDVDCADGSDENDCGNTNSRPFISPLYKTPQTQLTNHCYVTPKPNNGYIRNIENSVNLIPNTIVNNGAQIKYKCNKNYILSGANSNYCTNGEWDYEVPQCQLKHNNCRNNDESCAQLEMGACYTPAKPKNGKIVYGYNNSIELRPSQIIQPGVSIKYKCNKRYHLVDEEDEDVCYDSEWFIQTPRCKKYCDHRQLNSISVSAHCDYQNKTISCNRAIPPRTHVTLQCRFGYDKPKIPVPNIIVCNEFGEWNYLPWKCQQTCGILTPNIIPYSESRIFTEIRNAPWHIAIYKNISSEYEFKCGGSIISSRIILSAAHCFWNSIIRGIDDKRKYLIGAGKTLKNYDAVEETIPQFLKILRIKIKDHYQHDETFYNYDIALVILTDFIKFNEYTLPVCVDYGLKLNLTYELSGLIGKVPGWGLTEMGNTDTLKILEIPIVDYLTCRNSSNVGVRKYISEDKFCAGNIYEQISTCNGDSGGGLMYPKINDNTDEVYYIYGIVSAGATLLNNCDYTKYSFFTNVNFYLNIIEQTFLEYS